MLRPGLGWNTVYLKVSCDAWTRNHGDSTCCSVCCILCICFFKIVLKNYYKIFLNFFLHFFVEYHTLNL